MSRIELPKAEGYKKRKYLTDSVFKIIFRMSGLISALFIVLIFVFIFERGIKVFLPGYEYGQQNLCNFLPDWNGVKIPTLMECYLLSLIP